MITLTNSDASLLDAYSQTVSSVYSKFSPSVVHIRRVDINQRVNRNNNEYMGSGFIISSDGYIISNHHVAADAKGLFVTLDDNTILKAEFKGSDASTDIAVL